VHGTGQTKTHVRVSSTGFSVRFSSYSKYVNGQNKYELDVVVLEAVVVVSLDGVVGAAVGDDETALVLLTVDGVVGAAVSVVDDVDFSVEG